MCAGFEKQIGHQRIAGQRRAEGEGQFAGQAAIRPS